MFRKKLNGGKQALLHPDTKSHSCPSHLTQGRRKEVHTVTGCTPAATWKRGEGDVCPDIITTLWLSLIPEVLMQIKWEALQTEPL